MWKWILEHPGFTGIVILGVGWFIVRLTPSIKDDKIYADFIKFLLSLRGIVFRRKNKEKS